MVCFVAMPFCLIVCKKWTRAKLCTNDSNMIPNSIFKAINTYSTILNYKIGMFCRNIFFHVHMQKENSCKIVHLVFNICMFVCKKRTHATLYTNDSNMISNSIFKAINTWSMILNYRICIFYRNIFLHIRMQKVNSCKIVHKWIKHDFIFNI